MFIYLTFIITLIIIDSVWILGASSFHKSSIAAVQNSPLQANFLPAALFYLLAPLGYIFFVRKVAKTPKEAFLYGALLGMLMYGTFDLSNKAVFKNYPWSYTIADMTWGTFCIGIVSLINFVLLK
jgi:uncharacterized membrane protein